MYEVIANIPKDARIVDVGSDHGKVPVYLLRNNIVEYAIASDISPYSLEKAKALAERHNIINRIDFRVGDGLDTIKEGECDTAIVAGLGARLIIEILARNKISLDRYILVPHQKPEMLRDYLNDNGYILINSKLVLSQKKWYTVFVAEKLKNNSNIMI